MIEQKDGQRIMHAWPVPRFKMEWNRANLHREPDNRHLYSEVPMEGESFPQKDEVQTN